MPAEETLRSAEDKKALADALSAASDNGGGLPWENQPGGSDLGLPPVQPPAAMASPGPRPGQPLVGPNAPPTPPPSAAVMSPQEELAAQLSSRVNMGSPAAAPQQGRNLGPATQPSSAPVPYNPQTSTADATPAQQAAAIQQQVRLGHLSGEQASVALAGIAQQKNTPKPDMAKVQAFQPPSAAVPPPPGAAQMQGTPRPAPSPVGAPTRFEEHMAPEQRKLLEEGRKEEDEGAQKLALVQSNAQESQADVYKAAREKAEAPNPEWDELQHQKQATLAHYEELQKNFEKGPNKVDPNHFYASKSTLEKIGLALSLGLGAAGAALSHGENSAQKIVDAAINNDIQAQTVNIENRREGLKNAQGLLAEKWRMFGDKEKGIAAAKQEMYQHADMMAKEMALRSGSQQYLAQYQSWHGQFQQKSAEQDAQHNVFKPAVAAPGNDPKKLLDMEKTQAEIEHLRGETEHLGDKGKINSAGMKAEEQAAARHSILRDTLELQQLNKKAGYLGVLNPADRARAESLRTQIGLHYNPAHGIQRVGFAAEQDALKKAVVPDVTHWGFPSAREARIGALNEEFQGENDEDRAAAPAFNVGSFRKVGK
jgi:hypothetical protein